MSKESIMITEIETDILGVFVKHEVLQDTTVIAVLNDLIKKLEK